MSFGRKQLIKPTPLALSEVVGNLKSMLQRLVGEDIEVRTALDAEAGLIRADPDQMSQILMNLAANARDAMPQGGTLIVQTARCEMPEQTAGEFTGPGVSLTVSDTGVGISPDLQEHIFEPFYTTKARAGTGWGYRACMASWHKRRADRGLSEPGGDDLHDSVPEVTSRRRPQSRHLRCLHG